MVPNEQKYVKHPTRRKTTGAPSADPVPPGGNKRMSAMPLQAAVELIKTQGFSALTQSGVAKLAGVRQSHLTYYFPTRSDFFGWSLRNLDHPIRNG
jgi:hypothetical protein